MKRRTKTTPKQKTKQPLGKQPAPMTFMDHVSELRSRLFWVAMWFIVTSGAVFPFFNTIIKLLMRPLGNEKLYYLTPIGGLGFMIKVSMYLGAIATMPVLVYHIYRFISPIVRKHSAKKGAFYIAISFILALTGIVFAYLVSLPSAIHFLTHVNIAGVSPMLTVDSYLSFIIAYLLAGALLFQLPLIMVIIDTIKPTPPRQWLKYERHMIVGAFIIGMLVTPTPNVIDQIIMAVPIIIMYQLGILLLYFRHKVKHTSTTSTKATKKASRNQPGRVTPRHTAPVPMPTAAPSYPGTALHANTSSPRSEKSKRTTRLTVPSRPQVSQTQNATTARTMQAAASPSSRRSIDGISVI